MEITAIIPARAGSKSLPNKNIRSFAGKPLLAHSIEHALASAKITRTILSTDSVDYADIARGYGCEVPFIRPVSIAGDNSTDLEVFQHALQWMHAHEQAIPEIVVHLRPTHPIRRTSDIDAMLDLLLAEPSASSVRSVSPVDFTPFKMWTMNEAGRLSPVAPTDIPEAYNQPRQLLPSAFRQNACIDVVRSQTILSGSMTGSEILGYVMSDFFDIDTEEEFAMAEQYLVLQESLNSTCGKRLRFVVDIDGILATITPQNDYTQAQPLLENIAIVNRLHSLGHEIVLFTARGYKTGIDWSALTRNQMASWSVCYDELHFGKPNADFYIDDKFLRLDLLRSSLSHS